MTNFRLFQTEGVSRWQFLTWMKMGESLTGRKQCRKRRNCLFWAIYPFLTVFSKDILHVCKNQSLFGKGLKNWVLWILGYIWWLDWYHGSRRWINALPHMQILGSFNSAAIKNMMSKIWTDGVQLSDWVENIVGKRNCSLWAISSFPTMFSKAVCCWCVKMSIYKLKV